MKRTSFCLGCNTFQSLTPYRILPAHFKKSRYFPLCFTCKGKLQKIVANAELQKGGWKDCKPLEISRYFHLLKNFIMGEE